MSDVYTAQQISSAIAAKIALKILLIGVSGAGKSFLSNVLRGCAGFTQATQGASVTSENSYGLVTLPFSGITALVSNMPGLIEADSSNIARNKKCLEEAFRLLPQVPTLVIFVMPVGGIGARLKGQGDFEVFNAVCNFVQIDTVSMSVIVNGVPFEELEEDHDAYRNRLTQQIRTETKRGAALHVDFVPRIPTAARANFSSAEMVALKTQMQKLVNSKAHGGFLTAKPMKTAADAQLQLENERLERERIAAAARLAQQQAAQQRERDLAAQREREAREKLEKERREEEERKAAALKAAQAAPPPVVYQHVHHHRRRKGCAIQ